MSASIDSRARDAADAWLSAADAGDAERTWQMAGKAFQAAATARSWAKDLDRARRPLGALTSRQLAVEQQLNGLPGAPPGEYVVQQYHAIYGDAQAVVETLTMIREHDGEWRVVGYFIR